MGAAFPQKLQKHHLQMDWGSTCANSLLLYSTLSPRSTIKGFPVTRPFSRCYMEPGDYQGSVRAAGLHELCRQRRKTRARSRYDLCSLGSNCQANSKFFILVLVTVRMVKMPYTKAEFGEGKQKKYSESTASAAGTSRYSQSIIGGFLIVHTSFYVCMHFLSHMSACHIYQ